MVHCDKPIPQRNIRRFNVGQGVDDLVNPHVLPAISLFVDDKESEVMPTDTQSELMKRREILCVSRQEREALRSRIQKVQRVMIARATESSRRYQPVVT